MKSSKQHIEDFVEMLSTDLTGELKKICTEVQSMSSLTIEMAAHCNDHNASQPHMTTDAIVEMQSIGNDILSEVKVLIDRVQ